MMRTKTSTRSASSPPMRCVSCSVPRAAGIARLTRERCDTVVSIPMLGRVSSLNVAAAAAVALFEVSARPARHVVAFACIDAHPDLLTVQSPTSQPIDRPHVERAIRTSRVHRRHRRGIGGATLLSSQVSAVEPGALRISRRSRRNGCVTLAPARASRRATATCGWMPTPFGSASPANGAIPADGVAAVLTVTGVNRRHRQLVERVSCAGGGFPGTSNVNFTPFDSAVANLVTVKLGEGGAVDILSEHPCDVIVDVAGIYRPTAVPVSAGRYQALERDPSARHSVGAAARHRVRW